MWWCVTGEEVAGRRGAGALRVARVLLAGLATVLIAHTLLTPTRAGAQPIPTEAAAPAEAAETAETAETAAPAAPAEASLRAPGSDHAVDAQGRPLRVRFHPGSRVHVSAGWATATAAPGEPWLHALEVRAGLRYRTFDVYGAGESLISWQLEHHVADGRLWPTQRSFGRVPAMEGVIYHGNYLRHDTSPYLIVPTSRPLKLPFPFDVGVEVDVGGVWVPAQLVRDGGGAAQREARALRFTPARAALLLDPWRSGVEGQSFELGVGARYDVDVEQAASRGGEVDPVVIHRLAPFSDLSVRLRMQDADGLTRLDARASYTPHWQSGGEAWQTSAAARVHVERVLIAVNDLPVALSLETTWRLHPETPAAPTTHELRALVGATFMVPLR